MKYTLLICTLFLAQHVWAQPANDDCAGAINIPSIDEYCSGVLEFNNIGATADTGLPESGTAVGCFNDHANGVWFSFTPQEPAVVFDVFAEPGANMIARTNLNVYTGNCNNLTFISCSRGTGPDDELLISGLTVGQTYYLMVESELADVSFTLCINEFVAPKAPESDCPDAVVLCDKSPFQVVSLFTNGDNPNELDDFDSECLSSEFNSSWYSWTCDISGTLEFTLTPNNFRPGEESDDIDFALFELPGGLDDCANKQMVRCMASGENVGSAFETWQVCNGPTGLAPNGGDIREEAGCQNGNNNFVDPIMMETGKSYALVVMNFSNTGLGFSIEFGGTGTFLGPTPDFDLFAIEAFECDKRIDITNSSTSDTDPIVNYEWNFGNGAAPQTISGEGPHEVIYESFGTKSIVLTVETSRGCTVTKILDVEIAECCDDFPTLDLSTIPADVDCFGDTNGAIQATGIMGSPDYLFSIAGGPFLPNTTFNELPAGIYDITIQDIKGCETTQEVVISEPPPIISETGPDITVDLGFNGQISADYSPMKPGDIITWTPPDGLSCTDCFDPVVTPPGTTTYTFTVTDINGCTSEASVTVEANIIRPLYFPNVITPTTQDLNSVFNIGAGRQVEIIEELCVFDRWGNIIFTCRDIEPNDPDGGWDGRVGVCGDNSFSNFVDNGVYVWTAKIRFIDGVVLTYADDVTVLK